MPICNQRISILSKVAKLTTAFLQLSQRHLSAATVGDQRTQPYDVVVVGGGIVGTATVKEIQSRYPKLKCAIVEKESKFAMHQSGKSSEVVHAGIYFPPDSLKTRLCASGLHKMYEFCQKHHIPHSKCGKLIVATEPDELNRLAGFYERAKLNRVPDVRLVDGEEIQQIEPHCKGLRAIYSPVTGIAAYGVVANKLVDLFMEEGGMVYTNFEVSGFSRGDSTDFPSVKIESKQKGMAIQSRYVITCAGLHSDKIAEMTGCDPKPKIVSFRCLYLVLRPEKCHLVKGNIYPVPDPRVPFGGFHITPRVNGEVWLGPSNSLAFSREGYNPADADVRHLFNSLSYSGLRKFVLKNLGYTLRQLYYGFNMKATLKLAQKLVPEITPQDVGREIPCGVAALAMSPDGSIFTDFVLDMGSGGIGPNVLHMRSAPSPAATSALAVAEMLTDEAEKRFQLSSLKGSHLG